LGDDELAPQNGGGHAEPFAYPAEYRLQDAINIDGCVVLLGWTAGLNRSDFDASIMFYRGRIGQH
jgi:hypothetical protein